MKHRGTIGRSVEFGLRFFGLWPGLWYAAINWSLWILLLLVAQYFLYSFAVLHFDVDHIGPLIDCLSLALAYTLLTLKLVNLRLKGRALREMIDAIAEDWKEASVAASTMTVMLQKAKLSHTCSNILMSFHILAASLYVIGGYVIELVQSNNDTRQIPVRMVLPFDCSTSPMFEVTMIVQFLHQVSLSIFVTTLNGFLLTLILHVSGQIDIMCENVQQVTLKRIEVLSTLRKVIYRHQKIIYFTNNINDLFSFMALLEFIWSTIVICCVGFAIMASIGTEDALMVLTKSITFYIAVTLEAFIFCYSGEYLSTKSKSIGDAVYESLWYNLKPRECQVLLFIIMRSQKHLTITAGGLMDLSLDVFTSIMKTSVSYISVLHAMY